MVVFPWHAREGQNRAVQPAPSASAHALNLDLDLDLEKIKPCSRAARMKSAPPNAKGGRTRPSLIIRREGEAAQYE
jgi:hypothetical protein